MVSAGEIDDSSSEKSAAVQEKGAEIAYYTPQIVSVYNCDKGMKIRWNNNVPGADYYSVYRYSSADGKTPPPDSEVPGVSDTVL